MTEAEWLACADIDKLVEGAKPWLKGRKKQLLLVALTRHVGRFLSDKRSLQALDVLERHLDGQAAARELKAARADADAAMRDAHERHQSAWREYGAAAEAAGLGEQSNQIANFTHPVADPVVRARLSDAFATGAPSEAATAAWSAMYANSAPYRVIVPLHLAIMYAARASKWPADSFAAQREFEEMRRAEGPALCALLRDILGNPFRPSRFDPGGVSAALSLARAACDERRLPEGHLDPARLAVLSDALEEAGCTEEDILTHLRSPGPHVRGCWALDLVLGKE